MKLFYKKGDDIAAIIKDIRFACEPVHLIMEPGKTGLLFELSDRGG